MRTHTRSATFPRLPAFTLAQALLLALLGLASVRPALAVSSAVVAWGWNTSDVTVSWNWSDDAEGDGGPIVLNGAWTQYANQAATFVTGDVLGARVLHWRCADLQDWCTDRRCVAERGRQARPHPLFTDLHDE